MKKYDLVLYGSSGGGTRSKLDAVNTAGDVLIASEHAPRPR